MKNVENQLKRRLNEDQAVTYPDFESMWNRIEQNEYTLPVVMKSPVTAGRYRHWRKITVAASLSALLAAAPVYAAIHYDWSNLLRDKGGVQAVLMHNLGQQLGQSITKDGVTLTLQTAIVDENRTVILYSLDVGKHEDDRFWSLKGLSLKDAQGKSREGEYSYQQWDEKNQRYNGYFESDWTPQQDTAQVHLIADNLQEYSVQEQELPLDIDSAETQSFMIGRDGLQKIEVQPFIQGQDKLIFSTATTFNQPEAKAWAYPSIVAYKDGALVDGQEGSFFGEPGENGEYTAQQYFKTIDVPKEQTTYKLQYMKVERSIDGPWDFDLQLSKKQMESGTLKTALNIPLEAGDNINRIEKMVVTPTQIRLSIRTNKKYAQLPYKKFSLEVDGRTLEGKMWSSPETDPSLITLRFERPLDLVVDNGTPITFVGKYKVTFHENDKRPLLLTNISEKKQTLTRQTGGYPVKWTYYLQGADLFVETGSEDTHFGGINQTHIGLGNERILGKPVTVNFDGDGNNKAIDVYKDFKGVEASIYMFYYTTNEPDTVTRVQLRP